jgi:hypothetical protein
MYPLYFFDYNNIEKMLVNTVHQFVDDQSNIRNIIYHPTWIQNILQLWDFSVDQIPRRYLSVIVTSPLMYHMLATFSDI